MKKIDLRGPGENLVKTSRIINEDQVVELMCGVRAALQDLTVLMEDMSSTMNSINDSVKEGTGKASEGIKAAEETREAIDRVRETIELDIRSRGGNVNKEVGS